MLLLILLLSHWRKYCVFRLRFVNERKRVQRFTSPPSMILILLISDDLSPVLAEAFDSGFNGLLKMPHNRLQIL